MLKGRESLASLIGKRRRFLPNRHSILSQTILSSLNLGKDEIGGTDSVTRPEESPSAVVGMVTCPVCGDKVQGEDYMINSHLDTCLARGTKRKLSQRTLLQLNFCSRSKEKVYSTDSGHIQANRTSDNAAITSSLSDLHAVDQENTECKSSSSSIDVSHNDRVASATAENAERNNCKVDSVVSDDVQANAPLLLESEMSKNENAELAYDLSGKFLATVIVGRRFRNEAELHSGERISLDRDPANDKDRNAIKVLSADSGSAEVLGFIPRELAQYLAPLMDMFDITFEGYIVSIPGHPHAAVPIQIQSQDNASFGGKECKNLETFKLLCRNALRVIQSEETSSHGMTKYQQNFVLLIQEVLKTNSHLFTYDEKTFLENFVSLSDDSQRLFVRLYTRKGPWFRMSNISYSEILDCEQAVQGLSAAGYACSIQSASELPKDDLVSVLNMLTVGELREISCLIDKKCSRSSKKQDYIALLLSSYEDGACPLLPRMVLEKTGTCIQISSKAELLIWRVERLFFLNGEQDLSAFLLVDLGIIKYPDYKCSLSNHIFSGRDDLLSYEEAIEVAQIMDQSLDENDTKWVLRCIEISDSRMSSSSGKASTSSTSESMASFFSRFSASWVYSKVVLLGVSFLERENRYNDAVGLLKRLLSNFPSGTRRGYWTLRLSIDLEHMGRLNESLSVAEDGLLDPWIRAGSRISLQRRVIRLGKPPRRWKIPSFSESVKRKITEVHVEGRPLSSETGMKSRFYGEDGEQCGVEQLALQYYAGEEGGGWQGVHTESGIWLTIFGILMWDTIFADVPDVFRSRFQTSPLDLETGSFYEVRKNAIESLLQKIKDGMAEEILITSWESHLKTACRGVNWDKHSLSELRAVVTCVGGLCLASLCRHLAQDYRSWSSGMPDLLLWRFHGGYSGEAKLVEVKGPRDRLSEQQRAWLLFLMDSGFNTEVCKISPPPSQ